MKSESDGREMWQAWRRREMYAGFWEENLKEGGHLEDLIADGRLLLKQILTTMGEEYRIYLALDKDKWRDVEHGNKPSGHITCGEFRDHMRNWLCSKQRAPFSQPARRARSTCLVS